MCDPVSAMAAGSMIMGVMGSVTQAQAIQQQSQAQAASANYNAQVARNNQIIANQNSDIALQQGQVQEAAQREKTAAMLGGIVSAEAASGVNPNEGSALNVRSSARESGEMDAMSVRYNSQLKARDFQTQAANFGAQAGLLDAQAGWDLQAGKIGVMSSLLGGASSVSDKWLKYQQAGVFNFGGRSGGGGWSSGPSGIDPAAFAYT